MGEEGEVETIGHRSDPLGHLERSIVTGHQLEVMAKGDGFLVIWLKTQVNRISLLEFPSGSFFICTEFHPAVGTSEN